MPQCPAFILTSSSPDVFNTELVDNNSYAHYVVRTLDMHNGTRLSPSSPSRANTVRLRPSLQCSSAARNPTIIVHPKSSSSEAKIVASLQWSHWPDSIFSTRWQAVRLEKVIPLKDSSFTPNAYVTPDLKAPQLCTHTSPGKATGIPNKQRRVALVLIFRAGSSGAWGIFISP